MGDTQGDLHRFKHKNGTSILCKDKTPSLTTSPSSSTSEYLTALHQAMAGDDWRGKSKALRQLEDHLRSSSSTALEISTLMATMESLASLLRHLRDPPEVQGAARITQEVASVIGLMANVSGSSLLPSAVAIIPDMIPFLSSPREVVREAVSASIETLMIECRSHRILQAVAVALVNNKKSASLRRKGSVFVCLALEQWSKEDLHGLLSQIMGLVRTALFDSDATVRREGRHTFAVFIQTWPPEGGGMYCALDRATQRAILQEQPYVSNFVGSKALAVAGGPKEVTLLSVEQQQQHQQKKKLGLLQWKMERDSRKMMGKVSQNSEKTSINLKVGGGGVNLKGEGGGDDVAETIPGVDALCNSGSTPTKIDAASGVVLVNSPVPGILSGGLGGLTGDVPGSGGRRCGAPSCSPTVVCSRPSLTERLEQRKQNMMSPTIKRLLEDSRLLGSGTAGAATAVSTTPTVVEGRGGGGGGGGGDEADGLCDMEVEAVSGAGQEDKATSPDDLHVSSVRVCSSEVDPLTPSSLHQSTSGSDVNLSFTLLSSNGRDNEDDCEESVEEEALLGRVLFNDGGLEISPGLPAMPPSNWKNEGTEDLGHHRQEVDVAEEAVLGQGGGAHTGFRDSVRDCLSPGIMKHGDGAGRVRSRSPGSEQRHVHFAPGDKLVEVAGDGNRMIAALASPCRAGAWCLTKGQKGLARASSLPSCWQDSEDFGGKEEIEQVMVAKVKNFSSGRDPRMLSSGSAGRKVEVEPQGLEDKGSTPQCSFVTVGVTASLTVLTLLSALLLLGGSVFENLDGVLFPAWRVHPDLLSFLTDRTQGRVRPVVRQMLEGGENVLEGDDGMGGSQRHDEGGAELDTFIASGPKDGGEVSLVDWGIGIGGTAWRRKKFSEEEVVTNLRSGLEFEERLATNREEDQTLQIDGQEMGDVWVGLRFDRGVAAPINPLMDVAPPVNDFPSMNGDGEGVKLDVLLEGEEQDNIVSGDFGSRESRVLAEAVLDEVMPISFISEDEPCGETFEEVVRESSYTLGMLEDTKVGVEALAAADISPISMALLERRQLDGDGTEERGEASEKVMAPVVAADGGSDDAKEQSSDLAARYAEEVARSFEHEEGVDEGVINEVSVVGGGNGRGVEEFAVTAEAGVKSGNEEALETKEETLLVHLQDQTGELEVLGEVESAAEGVVEHAVSTDTSGGAITPANTGSTVTHVEKRQQGDSTPHVIRVAVPSVPVGFAPVSQFLAWGWAEVMVAMAGAMGLLWWVVFTAQRDVDRKGDKGNKCGRMHEKVVTEMLGEVGGNTSYGGGGESGKDTSKTLKDLRASATPTCRVSGTSPGGWSRRASMSSVGEVRDGIRVGTIDGSGGGEVDIDNLLGTYKTVEMVKRGNTPAKLQSVKRSRRISSSYKKPIGSDLVVVDLGATALEIAS